MAALEVLFSSSEEIDADVRELGSVLDGFKEMTALIEGDEKK